MVWQAVMNDKEKLYCYRQQGMGEVSRSLRLCVALFGREVPLISEERGGEFIGMAPPFMPFNAGKVKNLGRCLPRKSCSRSHPSLFRHQPHTRQIGVESLW
jgi:hypothetical protein